MTPSTARVAIVTGGSGGIGQAVAERLARDGLSVVVHYAGNSARAEEVVETITSAGGTAICASADVADEGAVARLFDLTERTYGGVDVVVHAAGRMDLAPLADMDLDVLDQMLRTNVRGTFVVDQQAARRLSPGGSILNFSSSVIGRVLPGYTGYAASKAAVEAMTFILAHEPRGRDITVNAIAPGRPPRRCSSRARTSRPSTGSRTPRRSSGWAPPRTSPRSPRSWSARPATGSTARP